jgi:hypothetical protein
MILEIIGQLWLITAASVAVCSLIATYKDWTRVTVANTKYNRDEPNHRR